MIDWDTDLAPPPGGLVRLRRRLAQRRRRRVAGAAALVAALALAFALARGSGSAGIPAAWRDDPVVLAWSGRVERGVRGADGSVLEPVSSPVPGIVVARVAQRGTPCARGRCGSR